MRMQMHMQKGPNEPAGRITVPPPQQNYDEAAAQALMAIRVQPAEQLQWLGASGTGQAWTIPVLDDVWTVELDGGGVRDSSGQPVGPWWRVLTLHYLGVSSRPEPGPPRSPSPIFREAEGMPVSINSA